MSTAHRLAGARCASDAGCRAETALPRHILPGAAMSYAHLEALRFLACCFGIGAAIGLIRGIIVELRRP